MSRDFPERVRQAMRQPAPGEHLTADVLNAYIERGLPASEEQQVLQHLAACAECREVVYLASEAVEEPAAHATPPVAERRIRWWTWAVPVAAVLVVAASLLLNTPFHIPFQISTKSAPSQQIAQAKREEPPSATTQTNAPSSAPKTDVPEKQARAAAPTVATPKATPPSRDLAKDKTTRQLSEDPLIARNAYDLQPGAMQPDAKAAPATKAQTTTSGRDALNIAAAAPPPAPARADAQAKGMLTTVEVSGAANEVQSEPTKEGKAKVAMLDAAGGVKAQRRSAFGAMYAKKAVAAPTWRVTPDGALEHLVLGEWQPLSMQSGVQFLAVCSNGENVWAAGRGLALYHSGDNGAHWERQSLPAEPSGDIVQLDFASPLDGVIKTTSSGEWATHDGGKSWSRVKNAVTPAP